MLLNFGAPVYSEYLQCNTEYWKPQFTKTTEQKKLYATVKPQFTAPLFTANFNLPQLFSFPRFKPLLVQTIKQNPFNLPQTPIYRGVSFPPISHIPR